MQVVCYLIQVWQNNTKRPDRRGCTTVLIRKNNTVEQYKNNVIRTILQIGNTNLKCDKNNRKVHDKYVFTHAQIHNIKRVGYETSV